ncbi:CobW family GTP-binding protein [Propionicimonas sp.]|uniref:CobW family GTP-binding protein n=1 Tax=Propionicimonas sp. TaxID=1955623 RepID=UPI0039E373D9
MKKRISRPKAGQVPVILISGIAEEPMAAATIGLQWDLPQAAVVRHEVDASREVLVRTVSDPRGIIERVEIGVEHACVNCAIREDVVPTLERLAASGQWQSLIAQLPVTADASQVCRVIGYHPQAAPHVRVAAAIVALEGASATTDLTSDDLLVERELPVRSDDPRGVAETAAAMVEYADVVLAAGGADASARGLIGNLARPGAVLADSAGALDAETLAAGIHSHEHSEDWVQVVRRTPLPANPEPSTWVIDFTSERPFHPDRLQERIELLGRGGHRSRGCFWLPSRPTQVCQWDGAGGMVSIGPDDHWEEADPFTRIVIVGVGNDRDTVAEAFGSCLLTDAELADRGRFWEVSSDGLEPWLGPIRSLSMEN